MGGMLAPYQPVCMWLCFVFYPVLLSFFSSLSHSFLSLSCLFIMWITPLCMNLASFAHIGHDTFDCSPMPTRFRLSACQLFLRSPESQHIEAEPKKKLFFLYSLMLLIICATFCHSWRDFNVHCDLCVWSCVYRVFQWQLHADRIALRSFHRITAFVCNWWTNSWAPKRRPY